MASLSVRGGSSRIAVAGSCVFLLGLVALLLIAPGARAAETMLWNNYSGSPDSIGFANMDGSGGGVLNTGTEVLNGPEGMAYDTVTNRLFVANYAIDKIIAINLDGSGASSFTAPGAPIEDPEGLTLDPVTRKVYWINTGPTPDTIAWANLDGSAGGLLAAGNVDAYRLAIDPVGGRLYWLDGGTSPGQIHYVGVNGGTGTLNITGASPTDSASGIAVDPAGGRVYWLNDDKSFISYASLAGAGGGDLPVLAGTFNGPYGLAIDGVLGRMYWANYSNSTTRTNVIGFLNLAGGGGGITVATAPIEGPQDPIILKSPSAAGAPVITRAKNSRSSLVCSTGTWGADFAGSFVYQAPRSFVYAWTLNGKALSAAGPNLNATKAGKYACAVTATNQSGSASQTSAAINVKAAKAKLTTKKKVTVKAGGVATVKVKAVNQGDLKSKNAKVCVKLPKAAKAALKAPKCKKLGKLKGRGKKRTTLKISVLPSASGVYSVSFVVKGSPGKAAKAKVVVVG